MSASSPSALGKSPLPSASIVTLPATPLALPQAVITKASLAAVQAISSIPLARISSDFSTKPGRCLAEQVGVKAPGTEKSAMRRPLKYSSDSMASGPSSVALTSLVFGRRAPTEIGMGILLWVRNSNRDAQRILQAWRSPNRLDMLSLHGIDSFPDRPVPAGDARHRRSALRTRRDRDVRARRRRRTGHRHQRHDRGPGAARSAPPVRDRSWRGAGHAGAVRRAGRGAARGWGGFRRPHGTGTRLNTRTT